MPSSAFPIAREKVVIGESHGFGSGRLSTIGGSAAIAADAAPWAEAHSGARVTGQVRPRRPAAFYGFIDSRRRGPGVQFPVRLGGPVMAEGETILAGAKGHVKRQQARAAQAPTFEENGTLAFVPGRRRHDCPLRCKRQTSSGRSGSVSRTSQCAARPMRTEIQGSSTTRIGPDSRSWM